MTYVKISGIVTSEDAHAAVDAGADLLGFFCSGGGARAVSPEMFRMISSGLSPAVRRVGIFAAPAAATPDDWRLAAQELSEQFQLIQYADNALWPQVIKTDWDMRRKIKAFSIASDRDLRAVAAFNGLVQNLLLNVHAGPHEGFQSGDTYGWELAREVRQYGKNIYLAGGLTPQNVGAAILRVHPYAVDVTVGVERHPGELDANLMHEFVKKVREADRRLS